jgi:thiol:disulfide interchange protein DsbA
MRKKILLPLLALFILIPLLSFATEGSSIKGVYTTAEGQKFTYDNGSTIEVIEFMSFYCGHCFEFEKMIPVIKGNFPKKVKWTRIPLFWRDGSPKPGEAYLLAVDAGKGDAMAKAIFHAYFIEKKDIGSTEVLEALALKVGMGFDFSHKLRDNEKAQEVIGGLQMAGAYRIDETPTIVIAGNIKTNSHATGHDLGDLKDNIITIIKSILK